MAVIHSNEAWLILDSGLRKASIRGFLLHFSLLDINIILLPITASRTLK